MAALARELVEQLQQLTEEQQRKVREFARTLRDQSVAADWEHQPWTEAEIRDMMKPNPKTGAELAAMIQQMHPIEPWGVLKPEDDSATYIHNQRRESSVILEESDESST